MAAGTAADTIGDGGGDKGTGLLAGPEADLTDLDGVGAQWKVETVFLDGAEGLNNSLCTLTTLIEPGHGEVADPHFFPLPRHTMMSRAISASMASWVCSHWRTTVG